MLIRFTTPLLNLSGNPLKHQGDDGTMRDATLADVCEQALLSLDRDKVRAFHLALRIHESCDVAGPELGKEIEMPPEDLTFIRAALERIFPPIVIGRAFALLGD